MAENVSKQERKKKEKETASTFWTEKKDKNPSFRDEEEKMIDRKAWTSNGKSKEKILFRKPRRQKKNERVYNRLYLFCGWHLKRRSP